MSIGQKNDPEAIRRRNEKLGPNDMKIVRLTADFSELACHVCGHVFECMPDNVVADSVGILKAQCSSCGAIDGQPPYPTERKEVSNTGFVIYDKSPDVKNGGQTYHYGDGEWGPDREKAFIYPNRDDAEAGLDDVDCDEILRDRLIILSAVQFTTITSAKFQDVEQELSAYKKPL